jgi:hypothetical protein
MVRKHFLFAISFNILSAMAILAAERPVSFNRDIKPIVAGKCYACHGPDAKERKAELRLDQGEAAHASGALQADKEGVIKIIARITSNDPELRMPPASSKKPALTPEEIELIKRWVAQGAKYDAHWAFVPPTKHPLPEVNGAATANPVDRFILATLAEQKLQPSPEADKRTLIRRLYFDLIGMPPTPEEVTAFEQDKSPEAYEKVVDRLLASQHYGERMAIYWLDVVRYADSAGYHSDNERNVTPYRDYVIRSFNNNLRIDQFFREQLAGDLLPESTTWQKVASGYNRLLQTTEEGGAQPKEYMAKYSADRARNFGSTFLALTTGCCECHDHKFDPLTTRDFYSLEAFFADIQEAAVGRREPGISVLNEEQTAEIAKLNSEIATATQELETAATAAADTSDAIANTKWEAVKVESASVKGTSKLTPHADGSYKTEGPVAPKESYELLLVDLPEWISGLRLEALSDDGLPAKGPGNATNGNFVLSQFKVTQVSQDGKELDVKADRAVADHSQKEFDVASLVGKPPVAGWAILPEVGKSHEAVFQLAKPLAVAAGEKVKITLEFQSPHGQHSIGLLRLSATGDAKPAENWLSPELRTLLAAPAKDRNADQKQKLAAYYRDRAAQTQPQREKLQAVAARKQQIEAAAPKCIVSVSGAPRTIRILPRGNWLDDSGEVMSPATPGFLGNFDVKDRRATRLDLAEWLVSPQHPLTSRVFVNRVWKLLFGRGITKAAEDFGTQGEYPSHPELLDTLAVEFRENGWDMKRLVKQLVMSRTYRQSSLVSKELREQDPANIYLARQSRYRMEAELVRDNALAVSGLLVPKIGGPSVFPYQPAGYWAYMNFPVREWQNSQGEGLYRRGLYTHWQRSFLHPSLVAFDAPSREECTVDRPRSNTPLQALVLLNDPTYVEAARALAAKTLAAASDTPGRLEYLFRRALQRSPRDSEVKTLVALYDRHLKEYQADGKAAADLMTVGMFKAPENLNAAELAAWTSVARVVLNLHEGITRN